MSLFETKKIDALVQLATEIKQIPNVAIDSVDFDITKAKIDLLRDLSNKINDINEDKSDW